MPALNASSFALSTAAAWGVVLAVALLQRPKFAPFVGVLLGIYSLVAIALFPSSRPLAIAFTALHLSVYASYLALTRPRMRPLAYRLLVSWPAAFFAAGTLLAWPWAVLFALGYHPWGPWVPYLAAAIGIYQSLSTRRDDVDVVLVGPGGHRTERLGPHPHGDAREERPLRIVQITDPHLGPFMSVARLRAICERAVANDPDLVVLTGDFLTMESHSDGDLLRDALAPLDALPGRVFACLGNHDHEAPAVVARAMEENGIALLVDSSREVETEAGLVQIVGMDFAFRDRASRLARVCAEHPRKPGATRIVLLHDPGAFRHLPEGEADLVLSGHTHGGQIGLTSLGLSWTILRLFGNRVPDHGFWARGTDRMYIHRGTGHYGFPLRLGVSAEESILRVHRPDGSPQTPR